GVPGAEIRAPAQGGGGVRGDGGGAHGGVRRLRDAVVAGGGAAAHPGGRRAGGGGAAAPAPGGGGGAGERGGGGRGGGTARGREGKEARARARTETINAFVTAALKSSDPNTPGGRQATTILEAMQSAVRDIESGRFRDDPETEAELRHTIGIILENNGHEREAL